MTENEEIREAKALSDEEAEQVSGGMLAMGDLPFEGNMTAGKNDVMAGSQVFYGKELPFSGSPALEKVARKDSGKVSGFTLFFRRLFGLFFR